MTTLGFDIEANGLALDDITRVWCIVTKDMDTGEIKKYHDYDAITGRDGDIRSGLRSLLAAEKTVTHNGICYDIPVLEKMFDVVFDNEVVDTLVLSYLYYPDRKNGHSAKAWGEKLGHSKVEHEDWSHFSQDMLHRCVEDVEIQYKIYNKLVEEAGSWDWLDAIETENKIAKIMHEQEKVGWYVDVDLIKQHVVTLDRLIEETYNKVYPLMPRVLTSTPTVYKYNKNGFKSVRYVKLNKRKDAELVNTYVDESDRQICEFKVYKDANLNSRPQVMAMLKQYGWRPINHTKKGNPQLDIESIEAMAEDFPGKDDLIKYFIYTSRRAHFQNVNDPEKGLLAKVKNHRIHGGAITNGCNTARMQHRGIVNEPRVGSIFGLESRSVYTCPEGRILVGCDEKGMEQRRLAHYLEDENFTRLIQTEDLHKITQERMGVDTRDIAKTLYYAVLYGAGDRKVSTQLGCTMRHAKHLRELFFEALPNLKALLDRVKKASQRGYLKGIDGRKLWVRRGEGGKIKEHTALNLLLQAAGAIVFKKANILMDEEINRLGLDAFQVINMHDEVVLECDPDCASELAKILKDAIIKSGRYFNLLCPLEGEAKIGTDWSQVH